MAAKLRYLLLIDLSTSVYGTEANSTINKSNTDQQNER